MLDDITILSRQSHALCPRTDGHEEGCDGSPSGSRNESEESGLVSSSDSTSGTSYFQIVAGGTKAAGHERKTYQALDKGPYQQHGLINQQARLSFSLFRALTSFAVYLNINLIYFNVS